jgi:hypothetical protein
MKTITFLMIIILLGMALVQGQGNSNCAHFCHDTFPSSGGMISAGQCTSLAARGKGPCYTCGPKQTSQIHVDVCSPATTDAQCCTLREPTCCTDADGKSTCKSLQRDDDNCGVCGHQCGNTEQCVQGSCIQLSQ